LTENSILHFNLRWISWHNIFIKTVHKNKNYFIRIISGDDNIENNIPKHTLSLNIKLKDMRYIIKLVDMMENIEEYPDGESTLIEIKELLYPSGGVKIVLGTDDCGSDETT
jgi:hypothetical protein